MTVCPKHNLLIFPEEIRIEKTFILNIVNHSSVLFLWHVDKPDPIYFLTLVSTFFFFFFSHFFSEWEKKKAKVMALSMKKKKVLLLIELFQFPFS